MRQRIIGIMFFMTLVLSGTGYAVEDQASLGTQAGAAAKELKDTADESYKTGAQKIGETSQKMEADAQDAFKTVQEQWAVLSKQLQEKTRVMSQQLQQQWQDFSESFNKPKQ